MRFLTEGMEAMAFTDIEYQAVKNEVAAFVESVRPPVHARSEFDVAYTIIDKTVDIGERRPVWKGEARKMHTIPIARIRYVNSWHLYNMPRGIRWRLYATVPTLTEALELVREDRHGCFWW